MMAQQRQLNIFLAFFATIQLCSTTTVHPPPASTTMELPRSPTGCSGEFNHRCLCGTYLYDGVRQTVTNCTGSNFTVEESERVLQQVSPDTEVLIFTGNNLPALPTNAFGVENTYEKLRVVDLSGNGLSRIQGQALHRVPNLEKLILTDNKLVLDDHHPRLFANVPNLKELNLENAFNKSLTMSSLPMIFDSGLANLISLNLARNKIGPGINKDRFCAFPLLKTINLSHNSLMNIVWNTSCLPNLMNLDLSYNHIPYLHGDTTHEMDTVPGLVVKLEGNMFQCDCNMVDFHRWLHETEVHVPKKEKFLCYDGFPENNTKAAVLQLSEENLQCEELLPYVAPQFGFLQVILVIVAVVLVLIIVAFAIFNRKNIAKVARVTFTPVSRRMQYSAIKKESETREVEL